MIEPGTDGAESDEVRDLLRRLARAGFPVASIGDTPIQATSRAVQAFQTSRGLSVSGTIDHATWSRLVEASYRLGDRLLYLQRPLLRGDDVAELQRRLGALGFDAGRADGILGVETELALVDFQRNAGLPTDAIAGPATIREIIRLGTMSADGLAVAQIRELETLRSAPRGLNDRRVVIGELGGLDALVETLARALRETGAYVVTVHHPDWSSHAATANTTAAEVYLGVILDPDHDPELSYYRSIGYESPGGHRLADRCAAMLATVVDAPAVHGRQTPILRETRMTAVLCSLADPPSVVRHSGDLARALVEAVCAWFTDPCPTDSLESA
jgi:N-acetylmuramoyl-L-alanine amidase